MPIPLLCLPQESSLCGCARRKETFQPKGLSWLNSFDQYRNEAAARLAAMKSCLASGRNDVG
ncbi:hypothetical protein DXT96_08010 [Agrobacterium sp. ICMP 6402]|nr:hypothetical protein [Agrobacterium sp. ICMP 6402]